ncbi:hypothetical protein HK100_001261 [Physocladia obscura]|uniref:Quinone oxidoreductase n=1 Tax=Physocladia obscura TaxID=109957 RepID=A0AAD5T314_9FUNG|nr:hypothetical protein HK100_001261 [Physocladia obscura]
MKVAQVTSWLRAPQYLTVAEIPRPSEDQIQLKVVAVGLHRLVRARASGKHYSANELPHIPGTDGVGIDPTTKNLYYFSAMSRTGGSFVDTINVDKKGVVLLPQTVDPIAIAGFLNPALSSWMALSKRTANLPPDFTVLILGATSASGKIAARVSRLFGAKKVIGVARNEKALVAVEGLNERVVLRDQVKGTDFSTIDNVDVVLDYIFGEATTHLLESIKVSRPLQYVQIGTVSDPVATIAGEVLRSKDITMRGSGPGSWSLAELGSESAKLISKMASWKAENIRVIPLKDVESAWNDEQYSSERVVFVP